MTIRYNGSIIAGSGGGGANPDETTIDLNSEEKLEALGTVNKNTSSSIDSMYNWIGTLAEYTSQNIETLHPEWICFITDDVTTHTPPSRNLGEIVQSTIPLTDAGLHLLDGSLISGSGSYSAFVTYIGDLISTNPEVFTQEYVSETSVGSIISGGDYSEQPKTNAFDGNITTWWGSSQLGATNILGNAYLGRSGLTKPVKKVRIYQGHSQVATNYCSQLLFQYSNDGNTWIDIDSITNGADKTWQEWILPDYTPSGSTHSFRVLAYGGFGGSSSNNWDIDELELYYLDISSETAWQTSNTNYGSCDKFVYDSVNNTVRLPKRTTEHGALIKSYNNASTGNWYRIYSDGWCEQGGITAINNSNTQVNLIRSFKDISYTGHITERVSSPSGIGQQNCRFYPGTTDYAICSAGISGGIQCQWVAYGYTDISDFQYSPIYEYIVIATSTKTSIEVDIDEIATDLNGKADVDLTNVNSSGTALASGWSMPSDTYDVLTLGASGATYTAPANGWFAIAKAGNNGEWVYVGDTTSQATVFVIGTSAGYAQGLYPVKKGKQVQIGYTANGGVAFFNFIYAEGEN